MVDIIKSAGILAAVVSITLLVNVVITAFIYGLVMLAFY